MAAAATVAVATLMEMGVVMALATVVVKVMVAEDMVVTTGGTMGVAMEVAKRARAAVAVMAVAAAAMVWVAVVAAAAAEVTAEAAVRAQVDSG